MQTGISTRVWRTSWVLMWISYLLSQLLRRDSVVKAATDGRHNLFGASDAKENPLGYNFYQESADAWVRRWSKDVKGVTDATTYFQNLVNDGYNPHRGYVKDLVNQVGDTRKYTARCVPTIGDDRHAPELDSLFMLSRSSVRRSN